MSTDRCAILLKFRPRKSPVVGAHYTDEEKDFDLLRLTAEVFDLLTYKGHAQASLADISVFILRRFTVP